MGRFDVALVGSGFAASILARGLARAGLSVALVERGRHPRVVLGESSTPLAGLALERLARRLDAPDLRALATWGRWGRELPWLRRGLKRGFTFYRHRRGGEFANGRDNEARLLVSASLSDERADAHWYRADVDHHLLRQAIRAGARYFEATEVQGVEASGGGFRLVTSAGPLETSRVVDASGPGRVLARSLGLPPAPEPPFQSTALATHFVGLPSFVELAREHGATMEPGPYPDERAAVHHLLAEGWAWVLPFDHGVASCGLVLRRRARVGWASEDMDPDALWREVLAPYATLARQLKLERATRPLSVTRTLAYQAERAAGDGWYLLPQAYAFFDPMFSTGIAWSLRAVERILDDLTGSGPGPSAYDAALRAEAGQIRGLIEVADLASRDFRLFVPATFLYFVNVAYAESRLRLGDPLAGPPDFLDAADPDQVQILAEARRRLQAIGPTPSDGEVDAWRCWVAGVVEARDVVGVDRVRRNQVPVDLDLLVARHARLGVARDEVVAALDRWRAG